MRKLRKYLNVPTVIITLGILVTLSYFFSFLLPITDNAYVVANIMPVSADVDGFITEIYVKNGQQVKKGEPLFKVFQPPYQLAFDQSLADLSQAKEQLVVQEHQLQLSEHLLAAKIQQYEEIEFDFVNYKNAYQDRAVSKISVVNLEKQRNSLLNEVKASEKEVEIAKQNIKVQLRRIDSLRALAERNKVFLEQTIVYAPSDGFVENMYLALKTPVKAREPLFSFVDTNQIYIQANFNETDLRLVSPGDDVYIFPRMYLGTKIYHGTVVSKQWSKAKQFTQERSQLQLVENEEQWITLPQRLPVQIQIDDIDPDYPLSLGSSAYVYVNTY